jgi:hypothetical protein
VFLCRSRERFPKVLRIVALCSKSTRPLTSQNFVVYTRQTSWRAHAGRRKVREERARRERERREWAVARVGGAVCGWWARRWARAEAEEAARMVREEAATRMQAVVLGHWTRRVVLGLRNATRQRQQLLREGAGVRVWGAWRCALAKKCVREAMRGHRELMAKRLALEVVREERAACVLQTCVRRVWVQWTMAFYLKHAIRLQCSIRTWKARRTFSDQRHRQHQARRAQAAGRMQWWWRGVRRWQEEERTRVCRERAAAFQQQMQELVAKAKHRERAMVMATYRMIGISIYP